MKLFRNYLFFCLLIFLIGFSSATPFIVGRVNDALDGTIANGRTVILWNPSVGLNDNVTDIIGPSGNSGSDNLYLIDCDLLSNGCDVGDEVRLQVLYQNNYLSNYTSLFISGSGFQLANNLTLNSPPFLTFRYPSSSFNTTNPSNFFCNYSDYDGDLLNVSLSGNWSAGWHNNQTTTFSSSYSFNASFSKNISDGIYQWQCSALDSLNSVHYSDNFTLTVDNSPPNIQNINLNVTGYLCGANSIIRVNCTVTDNLTLVGGVFFRAYNNGSYIDYPSQTLSSSEFYSDIIVDNLGGWTFGCFANDSIGNLASLNSSALEVYSSGSELSIFNSNIYLNSESPLENQIVNIHANVTNNGCGAVNNFPVGFYDGDPSNGGVQIGPNQTYSFNGLSNFTVSINWTASIGNTLIFIHLDSNNTILELNEFDNFANFTKMVSAWQTFYGNATIDKVLSNSTLSNITSWLNQSSLSGNIFIADTESVVSWQYLLPFGKNISYGDSFNDFSDLDISLGMVDFNDSISSTYTSNGFDPIDFADFLVYQRNLSSVPIHNLEGSSSFFTGILWDSSDDTNGNYDPSDKEDVVFVSMINNSKQGLYGNYDYEIDIPVKLREYYSSDSEQIYFYFDLN